MGHQLLQSCQHNKVGRSEWMLSIAEGPRAWLCCWRRCLATMLFTCQQLTQHFHFHFPDSAAVWKYHSISNNHDAFQADSDHTHCAWLLSIACWQTSLLTCKYGCQVCHTCCSLLLCQQTWASNGNSKQCLTTVLGVMTQVNKCSLTRVEVHERQRPTMVEA